MKGNNTTEILSEFSANLTFEDIPKKVLEHIKLLFLDGVGCCIHGNTLPWTKTLMEVVLNNTDIQECTIIGTGIKTSLLNATLINSTAGHGFESDDIHRESILHPNSIIVPVSINVSEKIKNISGKDFLTAVVAGYEVATRVGSAAGTELLLRGFHPQGTHGTIASTVTAAKLMNLNRSQTLHAIGIAGSLGAGLMAAQEGAMVKRLHSGRAAEAGVLAAELAAKKFTGISNIIEADYGGFLSSFSGKNNFVRSTDQLGEVWECANTGIKPYSSVTSIHAALDCLKTIMRNNKIISSDIKQIKAKISHPTYIHCAWAYENHNVTSAQMNIYYGLALIALEGELFVDQFSAEKISNPEILGYMKKISAEVDPEIEKLGHEFRHMASVELITNDNKKFIHTEKFRKGSPENPIPRNEILEKFNSLAKFSYDHEKIENIKEKIEKIEKSNNIDLFN
jgi:2-methylcitrate dehydratase PrpD